MNQHRQSHEPASESMQFGMRLFYTDEDLPDMVAFAIAEDVFDEFRLRMLMRVFYTDAYLPRIVNLDPEPPSRQD